MISTRSVGLLIDTVVCLTLAKWETVSGRFGGYFTWTLPQSHPGPTAIVIDELDAGRFQRVPNCQVVGYG